MNILQVHNPNNLQTLPYTQLVDFQGDLKNPIEPEALEKMRNSLKKHGVFVPKFVWFDEHGQANILDGHQTKQGLASLEADGWTIPEIPYLKVEATSREDAAEKLLQINSRYAEINPQTTWFESFKFPDLSDLLGSVEIQELSQLLSSSSDLGDIPTIDDYEDHDMKQHMSICPKCGFEYAVK